MSGIFLAAPPPVDPELESLRVEVAALRVFAAAIRADYTAGGHITRADVKTALDTLDATPGGAA